MHTIREHWDSNFTEERVHLVFKKNYLSMRFFNSRFFHIFYFFQCVFCSFLFIGSMFLHLWFKFHSRSVCEEPHYDIYIIFWGPYPTTLNENICSMEMASK